MEHLPIEIVNKIMLYNSHPCADIIRNCDKPPDRTRRFWTNIQFQPSGYKPMVMKLKSWYKTTKSNDIIRYEYNLIFSEIFAMGEEWGKPCVFCN
tara:strand:- start:37 stop:321 length:285 start_codon:yes stop_codon:yes gene_type:complete